MDAGTALASGILMNIRINRFKDFKTVFPNASEDALDLLQKLLIFNPKKRLNIDQALEHPFVKEFRNTDEELVMENKVNFELTDEEREEIYAYREQCLEKQKEQDKVTRSSTLNN